VFLSRQGHVMSQDRAHRIWRQHGLQVPRKRPRKRVAASRPRPLPASAANQVWAYDFVYDACANGQQLKCLTVIDEYTRECLAIDVSGNIRHRAALAPRQYARCPTVSEVRQWAGVRLQSRATLADASKHRHRAQIDPGKPWQNGSNESFNGKFRDECLSMQLVQEPSRCEDPDRKLPT